MTTPSNGADNAGKDYSEKDYSEQGHGETGFSEQAGSGFETAEYPTTDYSAQVENSQPEYSQPEYSQPDFSQQAYSPQNFNQQAYSQPGYAQPGYPQQPGYSQFTQQTFEHFAQEAKRTPGFFQRLFDFKFKNFVTVDHAAFLYMVALVVGVIHWLAGFLWTILGAAGGSIVSAIAYDITGQYLPGGGIFGVFMVFGYLIFGTLALFVYVVSVRVLIEFLVAQVKTAENTRDLLEQLSQD